jgi:hypothetical protein
MEETGNLRTLIREEWIQAMDMLDIIAIPMYKRKGNSGL